MTTDKNSFSYSILKSRGSIYEIHMYGKKIETRKGVDFYPEKFCFSSG